MQPQEQATGVRFQWGNIVLTIDSPNFCNGFSRGHESHRNECEEEPRRERELVAPDFLELIALPDARSGHYRFDHPGDQQPRYVPMIHYGAVSQPIT
jgi:hypothetical protein